MTLDSFTLSNVVFSSGKLTATVSYSVSLGIFDTISTIKIRIYYYDNSSTRSIDQALSNNVGTFPITLFTTGPYLTISGQEVAGTTLSGNVLQGGTYYPLSSNNAVAVTLRLANLTTRTFYMASWDPTFITNTSGNQVTILSAVPVIHTITDTYNDITNWIFSNTTNSIIVVVKAVDGTTATFSLTNADATGLDPAVIVSKTPSSSAATNTLNDVAVFFQNHNHSIPTPPIPIEVFDIRAIDGTAGTYVLSPADFNSLVSAVNTSVLPYFDGKNRVNISNAGLTDSTNTRAFALLTSLGAVNQFLTAHQFLAPLPMPNFSYNIQIPNVANALQLITATNYGTTNTISFPAQSFVNTVLNQSISSIPNTLNAVFLGNVSSTPNDSQIANALISYFPVKNDFQIKIQTPCGQYSVFRNSTQTFTNFTFPNGIATGNNGTVSARTFVEQILGGSHPEVPNTLNVIIGAINLSISDKATPNMQAAQSISDCYTNPPAPPATIFDKAKGLFAGLITLYLISGSTGKKGKK